LDTHELLWLLFSPEKLPVRVRELMKNPKNEIFASTISFWEMTIKYGLGKLDIQDADPEGFEELLWDMRIGIIGLNEQESLSFYRLPAVEGHRDPFDRMLVWQAIKRGMALLSVDRALGPYRAFGLRLIGT
jgi:PIN domain nuclease of toxin-antitoxin system